MGIFDTFYNKSHSVSVQLKIDPSMSEYTEGDYCELEDGIYVSHLGGFVLIENGQVILVTDNRAELDKAIYRPIFDKYGDEYESVDDIL